MPAILDEGSLRDVAAEILRHDAFFFDVESMGEHRGVPHLNDLFWIGLSTDGLTVEVPFGHPIGTKVIGSHKEPRMCADNKVRNYTVLDYEPPPKQLRASVVFDILRPLFLSRKLIKIATGASFDLASVPKYLDHQVERPYECTIVLDWLLNENLHQYNLKTRTKQIFGVEYEDKKLGREVEKHPFEDARHYLHLDAKYGWLQWKRNRPGIQRQHLEDIYELELDILEIMVAMRQRGARVDVAKLTELRETLSVDLVDCESRLYRAAGQKFNINSNPQKQRLLFGPKEDGGQGLAGWKLTDGARKRLPDYQDRQNPQPSDLSTDAESLEDFVGNPMVDALLEYQDIDKLLNTYVISWLGDGAEKPAQIYDQRIFADFVQYGTKTGRFSCRAPNLQNIPRGDTEHGKMLRDAWIADLGYLLAVADYGQIEPRMMAHFLGCGMLYDGFHAGFDPYIVNASAALGIAMDKVTKDQRQTYGKTMFLAMGYGAGYRKLAGTFGVTEKEAKRILARHEESMPEVPAFKEALIEQALSRQGIPYIRTILGRKRRVPELLSKDNYIRSKAERQLFNSLIQGSAADLMKLAMVRTFANLTTIPGAYIALTVHDELSTAAPKERIDDLAEALRDGMIGPGIQKLIGVPLKADVVIGNRWGECK